MHDDDQVIKRQRTETRTHRTSVTGELMCGGGGITLRAPNRTPVADCRQTFRWSRARAECPVQLRFNTQPRYKNLL